MSLLPKTGKIYLVREPVCGRFGLPRMIAKLSSNDFKVGWNGTDEITVVTFNRKCTTCKIVHMDATGADLTSRVLYHGKFKIMLEQGLIPRTMSRADLERLIVDGTLEGEYQHAQSAGMLGTGSGA